MTLSESVKCSVEVADCWCSKTEATDLIPDTGDSAGTDGEGGQRRGFLLIHIASVSDGDHHDEEDPVINGVDNSIVTHSEPKPGMPSKRTGRRRTRIVSEQRNRALDTWLGRSVNLSNFA